MIAKILNINMNAKIVSTHLRTIDIEYYLSKLSDKNLLFSNSFWKQIK